MVGTRTTARWWLVMVVGGRLRLVEVVGGFWWSNMYGAGWQRLTVVDGG